MPHSANVRIIFGWFEMRGLLQLSTSDKTGLLNSDDARMLVGLNLLNTLYNPLANYILRIQHADSVWN